MTEDDYSALLDWTGREMRAGKRGAIPAHLAPLLERLAVDCDARVEKVTRYGSIFWRVAGRAASILDAARACGRGAGIQGRRRALNGAAS